MDITWLTSLKNYLSDRPEAAFLSISLAVNLTLFRMLLRAKDDQLALVLQWMPVAERMTKLFETAVSKSKRKQLPSPSSSGE